MAGQSIARDHHTSTAGAARTAEAGGVAAVDRALAILAAFRPEDTEPLTLAELADRTGLYKSTLLRLAQSLIRHQLLLRLDDGRYRLGTGLLRLAALCQQGFALGDILLPLMRELAQQTGESVAFYIRDGDERLCLYRVESHQALRYAVREGDILPLRVGSAGHVIAAFSSPAGGDPYDRIRRELHYISLGERDPAIAGLSAPVFSRNLNGSRSLVGALTLAGPRARVDDAFIHAARVPLLRVAARASSQLGGDPAALQAVADQIESASV